MNTFWKGLIAVAVIAVVAFILVSKSSGQPDLSPETGDGSSLGVIQKTIENGKPTLLLLRTST